MILSGAAWFGFQQILRLGCYFKLIPYNWNYDTGELCPAFRLGKSEFIIQKYLMLFMMAFTCFRFIHSSLFGNFSLLSALWVLSQILTAVGLQALALYQDDIMNFTNRLLRADFGIKQELSQIDKKEIRYNSEHMFLNLFLFVTNPQVHTSIVEQYPCAPVFISSIYFQCGSIYENSASLLEKGPFLIFGFYQVFYWQYQCSFQWSLLFLGLSYIKIELKKLSTGIDSMLVNSEQVAQVYQMCRLLNTIIGDILHGFLRALPGVGVSVVALLLYGVVRLWRIHPQSNIMFPLCALRCGFETLTPLAMAGVMYSTSRSVLEKWKIVYAKNMGHVVQGNKRRLVKLRHGACRPILCKSGSFFTFEGSILLVVVDNFIQMTVNLLVSFPSI